MHTNAARDNISPDRKAGFSPGTVCDIINHHELNGAYESHETHGSS